MSLLPRLALVSLLADAHRSALADLDGRVDIVTTDSEEEARAQLEQGAIDGAILPRAPSGPRLRLRDRVRVIEPCPGLGEVDAETFLSAARAGRDALLGLGVSSPTLVAFEGAEGAQRGAELARREGIDLVGPLAPRAAVERLANAYITSTASQAELLLALKGTGPETGLALGEPFAWPYDSGQRALLVAVERLLKVLPHPLVAEREEARKPAVSVAKRAVGSGQEQGRCPYCHHPLSASPDGSDAHPGPPVACAECGTEHHRDCVTDHGRCTILGCGGTRVLRLGVTIPLSRLGGSTPRDHPFLTLAGDAGLQPQVLRVEAPIDDPDARPTRRRLGLELASRAIKRGEWLEGYVVVWAPRPFRVRGGALTLQAALSTRQIRGNPTARLQPILGRRASFAGDLPAGALGRLQDEVLSLFVKGKGVPIPAGVRRYPFSFRVDAGHPATVKNRLGEVEEQVTTVLEATLDTDYTEVILEVR